MSNLRLIVCGPGNEDGTWIEAESIEAFERMAEAATRAAEDGDRMHGDNVLPLFDETPRTYAEVFGPARMMQMRREREQQRVVALLDAEAPAHTPNLEVWAAAIIIASVESRPVAVRQLGVSVPDPVTL